MFLIPLVMVAHVYATHTVVSGDTLYGISQQATGNGYNWSDLYAANRSVIGDNPNFIVPGERIILRFEKTHSDPPPVIHDMDTDATPIRVSHHVIKRDPPAYHGYYSGTLNCTGLERLWESAGGNSGSAFIAAEIAMAESGGNQYATGLAGERGYWQINPDHGYLSTYNAFGNARAAVIISGNGSNWDPWTTFTSGAYIGRC